MIPFGSGLRKTTRRDPVKMSLLRTPPELVGACYFYGRIKSGKTTSMLSFAQLYHDNPNRKYKIFDLWGGSRHEHLYWGLPSNQTKYWNYVQKKLRLNEQGPKQYHVTYYYPLTKKLRKELPFKPGYVTSKIFTLDVTDLSPQDFALTIGSIPDKTIALWKETISEIKRIDTIEDVVENFKKKVRKDDTLYNSVIKPLMREGLLQKKDSPMNLTTKQISKELDDKENIAVLSLDFIDKEYQLFIIGYLLRKICDELDRKRRKTIGIIREASEFFRVNDQSIAPDRMKVFKTYISDWIKMGRRGLHLFLDTQSPNETRGLVDGQQDLTMLGRLPSEADRRMATEQIYKDGLITKKQIIQIGVMNPGQFIICPSGKPANFSYILLPRSRYWQEKNGNFYNNIWEKDVGHWMNFKEEINKLEEEKEKEQLAKQKIKEEKLKELAKNSNGGVLPEEIDEQFDKLNTIKILDNSQETKPTHSSLRPIEPAGFNLRREEEDKTLDISNQQETNHFISNKLPSESPVDSSKIEENDVNNEDNENQNIQKEKKVLSAEEMMEELIMSGEL